VKAGSGVNSYRLATIRIHRVALLADAESTEHPVEHIIDPDDTNQFFERDDSISKMRGDDGCWQTVVHPSRPKLLHFTRCLIYCTLVTGPCQDRFTMPSFRWMHRS
jgi:hypothetical protein